MKEGNNNSAFTGNDRKSNSPLKLPAVSGVFDHGQILEMVFRPKDRETAFILWNDGKWTFQKSYKVNEKYHLIPYSPYNNLIKNEVILLPSIPEEYETEESLVNDIQTFIHRYVDLSPLFEKIATYYVLFSWIYDGFNELPYLKLRGDFGSGKTRFLLTVGSLCYKPIFASGASSVSPLFRILDIFRGTLIMDEADFRLSDEKADVVKILNNGNVKGFPVLRSEVVGKEYNPKAYHVFGPKIVATRGFFEDRALESRFLAEEMGRFRLRSDIPINLPSVYKEEALHIRNKLLLFRFRNLNKRHIVEDLVDRRIEPRLNQIFVPLLSIIKDNQSREELRGLARQYNREMIADRGIEVQAQVLEIIQKMVSPQKKQLSVSDITSRFITVYGEDYEFKITTRWIGNILRKKLNLKTHKYHGAYVISHLAKGQLEHLYEKYGIKPNEEKITNEKTGP